MIIKPQVSNAPFYPILNNNCETIIKSRYNPVFGNKICLPYSKRFDKLEKITQKFELVFRKAINKLGTMLYKEQNKNLSDKFMNIDEKSDKYIEALFQLGRKLSGTKEVEINVESEVINNITKSNESCIFIMNHDNQKRDPQLLMFFNTLLSRDYIQNGLAEKCPRPKIILNEDIIDAADPIKKSLLEKIGAVGIDASLFSPNLVKNGKKLFFLIKDFIADKSNIFIFPEGKMCAFKNLDPEYRFQTGVGDIINQISKKKNRVKVVPLGFAYNGKNNSIHMGEPIYFKKENGHILATSGSVKSNFASSSYADFFKKNTREDGYSLITKNGIPVEIEEAPDYVAGILCENLKICRDEAKKAISKEALHKKGPTIYLADDNDFYVSKIK